MTRIYCLGGAPRSGKTLAAQQFLRARPVSAFSTDSVRHMLRQLPNALPDLFAQAPIENLTHAERAALDDTDPERYVELQNKESAAVWQAAALYLDANQQMGIDTFVEGVAVLPKYVAQLPGTVQAVFVGNQSAQHWIDMHDYARSHPSDGMNHLHLVSDQEVEALARRYQAFSRFIKAEAEKYGYPYIDMSAADFSVSIDRVVQGLLHV